jgi:hypothetical protein
MERGVTVTKSDHEAKARDFVDNILRVNTEHGVGEAAGVIKYDDAVKAVTKTFKRLRKGGVTPPKE